MAFKNSALLAMLSAVSVLGAPENFGLFGYGKGIGGLPLFYADGECAFTYGKKEVLTAHRLCLSWTTKSIKQQRRSYRQM